MRPSSVVLHIGERWCERWWARKRPWPFLLLLLLSVVVVFQPFAAAKTVRRRNGVPRESKPPPPPLRDEETDPRSYVYEYSSSENFYW